jgi:acyl-CoA synthetase (AMP-forming)/AMP-acid ligase II/acyl carrier protein
MNENNPPPCAINSDAIDPDGKSSWHPNSSMFISILQHRAQTQPNRVAYTYLHNGESSSSKSLTYSELAQKVASLSQLLRTTCRLQDRVLVLLPPGLDFIASFYGCLAAGLVAVPAPFPNRKMPPDTLQKIANDVRPKVILTAPALDELLPVDEFARSVESTLLRVDNLPEGDAEVLNQTIVKPSHLALIQYTSGSTSTPRGVMLSYSNLIHNQHLISKAFQLDENDSILSWLPPYHDMGLIGSILHPLYLGIPCTLMNALHFIRSPVRWLRAISDYRATVSGGPNFGFELCRKRVTEEETAQVDLSSWRVAYNGSDTIWPETIRRFSEKFQSCGFNSKAFYPCYGLAEATLLVSSRTTEKISKQRLSAKALRKGIIAPLSPSDASQQAKEVVSCGQVLEQKIAVVDEDGQALGDYKLGEVWVSGDSVAQGYWNKPEESEKVFRARLNGDDRNYLRTGDLGFKLEGELFIVGRSKDLIIIRGQNYFPQDIELTIKRAHPAISYGATVVFTIEALPCDRLVVVQEIKANAKTVAGEIFSAIRTAVAEQHNLVVDSIALIRQGGIPKTSSGKLRRRNCRSMYSDGELPLLALNNLNSSDLAFIPALAVEDFDGVSTEEWEKRFRDLIFNILSKSHSRALSDLEGDWRLNVFGLDSLTTLQIQHSLETVFGIKLPTPYLFQAPTISELTSRVRAELREVSALDKRTRLSAAPNAPHEFPLSHGQHALWTLHNLSPESTANQIARAARLYNVDRLALGRAFQTLAKRHDALRITIEASQGKPLQRIHRDISVDIICLDMRSVSTEDFEIHLAREAARPFDFAQGPLFRFALYQRSGCEHVLLIVAHHLVSDFWSFSVLLEELGAIYTAEIACTTVELPTVGTSYAEHVHRQLGLEGSAEEAIHLAWWRSVLPREFPVLNLFTDQPRPSRRGTSGSLEPFKVEAAVVSRLKELSRDCGVTLFTLLLGAYHVLLHRYSGQDQIIIGATTSGRTTPGFDRTVGYFVNPIPVPADFSDNPPFIEFLNRLQALLSESVKHQAYPFPLLVEQLRPPRHIGRGLIFEALFTFQRVPFMHEEGLSAFAIEHLAPTLTLGALWLEGMPLPQGSTQFDLDMSVVEFDGGLAGRMKYSTEIFDQHTIQRLLSGYVRLLEGIAASPDSRVLQYSLLTEDEQRELLQGRCDNDDDAPSPPLLQDLFERQVAAAPTATATVFQGQTLTYAEIKERTDNLATLISKLRTRPE